MRASGLLRDAVDRARHTLVTAGRRPGVVGGLVGAITGLVILNVVMLPGYSWSYDMVFVPDLPWSDRTLGVDGSVPRAVPTDAVVALLEQLVPGDVLQAILLWLVFVVAGAGCGRLARTVPGAATASLAAGWNPYVVERLVVGHWSFLLGFACLPWIHAAAVRTMRHDRGGRLSLAAWLALASLAGSTSAVIAGITAVASLALAPSDLPARATRVRSVMAAVILLMLYNAAWIVPSLTRPTGLLVDVSGVDAFSARAENAAGVLPSLMTLGGIWHAPSVPGSRASVVVVIVALLVGVGILAFCLRRGLGRELLPLAVAGGVGLLVAAAATLPGGRQLVESVMTAVPGLGIVRDGQKFVAPLAVLLAVASGRAVDLLVPGEGVAGPARNQRWIVVLALAVAPIALLPDAPFAAGRAMGSVTLPAQIGAARDHLERAAPGAVAVFPWTQYRRFGWNDDRISLDPWNRLLDRRVIVNDELPLSTRTVHGEDPVAARVSRALAAPGGDLRGTLSDEGVRWVLLLTDQPGAGADRLGTSGQDRVFGTIRIIDLGPPTGSTAPRTSLVPMTVTAATTAMTLVAWMLAGAGVLRLRRRRVPVLRSSDE